jgi:hypothetical protein
MLNETIETRAHTVPDGKLHLSLDVGVSNADVDVTGHVKSAPPTGEVDANGWPKGFFERVAGSMPELECAPQGGYEERQALG